MSPPSLLCGEDRFYCHPGARGSDYSNYKNGKNRGNGIPPRNISKNFMDYRPAVPAGREETCRPEARPPPAPRLPADRLSNIDRFLLSTTPSVPAQYLSKATTGCLRDSGAGFQPYFVLEDLWEAYTEWSVYGAGVPLVLRGRDRVVQYYVPYLSGIQLYAESSRHATDLRRPGEESDGDLSRDSSSDVSSDSEFDGWSHSSDASAFRSAQGSTGDKSVALSDGFSSDDSDVGYAQEQLLFEYFEHEIPYSRVPFADKISELACQYPELRTLRSCDLLPTSWVSVAWYPIYRIPAGPTMRDLDACFLTFHSLSMPRGFRGDIGQPITSLENNGCSKIPFPAIGMASYKLHGSAWSANGGNNRLRFLQQEADKLLTQLQVYHPDYQFFVSRSFRR